MPDYFVLDNLTGKRRVKKLLDGLSDRDLTNIFMRHFNEKITNIVSSFEESEQAYHVTYISDNLHWSGLL